MVTDWDAVSREIEELRAEHTYPSAYPKGTSWAMDEVWRCLDKLKPGLIDDDVRGYIVGFMAASLDSEREKVDQIVAENTQLRAALKAVIHAYGSQEDGGSGGMDRAIAQAKLVAGPVDTSDIPEAGEDFFMSAKLRTPPDPM